MLIGTKKGEEGIGGKKACFAFFALFAFLGSSTPLTREPDFYNGPLYVRQSGKAKVIRVGQQFELKIDQEAKVEGEDLIVKFDSLLEDSRCPEGVNCIRAGNARIRIKSWKGNQTPSTFEINTDEGAKSSSYLSYEIALVALKPQPKPDAKVQPNEYNAMLVVTKK